MTGESATEREEAMRKDVEFKTQDGVMLSPLVASE